MTALQACLVAARFTHYAALTIAFGAALFPLYAYPRSPAPRGASRRVLVVSAVAALLSGLAWLLAAAANMADDPAAAIDPSTLSSIVTDMAFGRLWAVRMALAVVLVALTMWSGETSRLTRALPATLAGALLGSLALTGHGLSGPAGLGPWHGAADALHLLAAGAWLGALVPLAALVRPDVVALSPGGAGEAAQVLLRFSRIGMVAVATLVGTGLVNAWLLVGTPESLVSTTYGRVLVAKLVLFALMLGLAAHNRFVITPELARLPDDADVRPWLVRLRRRVLAEQGLGLAILALVGVLGTLAPPVVE